MSAARTAVDRATVRAPRRRAVTRPAMRKPHRTAQEAGYAP
jgi:hypothetical protein